MKFFLLFAVFIAVSAVLTQATDDDLPKCGENQQVKYCGTACEPSCSDPDPDSCTKQCLLNACQCKKGYVRDEDAKCIKLEDCKEN